MVEFLIKVSAVVALSIVVLAIAAWNQLISCRALIKTISTVETILPGVAVSHAQNSSHAPLAADARDVVASQTQTSGNSTLAADARRHFNTMNWEETHHLVSFWTMVEKERLKFVYDFIAKLNRDGLQGDIVECGVWKGGSTMSMIFSNMRYNTDRNFYLFDTFEGLPRPTQADGSQLTSFWDRINRGEKNVRRGRLQEDGKWNFGPEAVVRNNMMYTQYPMEKIHFIRGKTEDSMKNPLIRLPERIVVLRLDTDLYMSTLAELEALYDRLVIGGLLFIDDFCSRMGSRRATVTFWKKRGYDERLIDLTRAQKTKFCLSVVKTKEISSTS